MARGSLAALSCTALLGLSCGVTALPPAGVLAVSAELAPAVADVAALEAPLSPEDARIVAAIIDHLTRKRRTGLTEFEREPVARTIVREARRHDIDPALILAVIHVESRFNTFAVSPVGAIGLMQIMPQTGVELAAGAGIPWRGPQILFDPILNVRMGVAYLRELADRFGNIELALAAYNWGPGHIHRRLRRGTPVPVAYPRLVLDAYAAKPRHS
jgi:soluble lytic murein transglycosylase-like protein